MSKVEYAKNISEIVRNAVSVVAIVIAGIWTYHTFQSLGQEREAEAKLAEIQAATAEKQASLHESQLKAENFSLDIEIATAVARQGPRRALTVEATFRNTGAGPLDLSFDESTFQLARLVPRPKKMELIPLDSGSPVYIRERTTQPLSARRLLVQQRRRMQYAFDIPRPGLYLVQVNVSYGDETTKEDKTFGFEQAVVRVP